MFIKGVQSITYNHILSINIAQLLTQPPWAYHTPRVYAGVKDMSKIINIDKCGRCTQGTQQIRIC